MWKPNVLYIAIDSLRTDAIQHTDAIQSLAEEHIYFQNAITPATWSLPAYTSLLSGEYPHTHGVTQPGDIPDQLTVVETLSSRGYSTYGVSGNPFFSPNQDFDRPFDEFWLTPRRWFSKGLDVANHEDELKKAVQGPPRKRLEGISDFGWDFLTHSNRLKSLGNIAFFTAHRLDLGRFFDTTIPHPLFDKPAYRPELNTSIVTSLLEREADSPEPFFIFAQYNDPHHENWPSKEICEEIGWEGSESEIKKINDQTATMEYLSNDVPQEVVEKRRQLYKGDVKQVDNHVQKILASLRKLDLWKDTIVIITADHGENLGERDRRGRRRMGHFASVSKHLINVPLILACSGDEADTIQTTVSTKDIGSAIVTGSLFGETRTVNPGSVIPEVGIVLSESPAKGGTETSIQKHPDAPVDVIREETDENSILGKFEKWDTFVSSTGERWAWHGPESTEYSSVPESLQNSVESALEQLNEGYEERKLTKSVTRNLEDMGYL